MQPRRNQPRARQPRSQLCHPGVSRVHSLEVSTRALPMRPMQQQQPAEVRAPQHQHGRGSHNSSRSSNSRHSKQCRSQHSSSRVQSCHHCLTSTGLTGTTPLQSASMLTTSTPTSAASSPSTAPQQTTWSRRWACISTAQLFVALGIHALDVKQLGPPLLAGARHANNHAVADSCHGVLSLQPDINEKMRAILIDWLVEVHLKFKVCRVAPSCYVAHAATAQHSLMSRFQHKAVGIAHNAIKLTHPPPSCSHSAV
jgi:hypothetical protein